MRRIIGLTGHARVGKDTVGAYLMRAHGFDRLAFADQVRQALFTLNPVICTNEGKYYPLRFCAQEYGWEFIKAQADGRGLLQRMGTDIGRRMFGADCWIKMVDRQIQQARPESLVITDVRYDNEAEYIRSIGGVIWEITRAGIERINTHASEQGIDRHLIHMTLTNDGTLQELYEQTSLDLKHWA